jgi:metallo-beta-lactamase class B
MEYKTITIISIVILVLGCKTKPSEIDTYVFENLKIERLTDNAYLHISYLNTKQYGKVACNGIVVINQGEAIVLDTPSNKEATVELLNWIDSKARSKAKAVVATHFHADCLAGLNEFHKRQIPSYALNKTIELAKANNTSVLPENGFENYLELRIGDEIVVNEFFGEGHTKDNIISYFPKEKVLFGGCLIKTDGAGKGNLNDANVYAWSNTVKKIAEKYMDVKTVVPGHGKVGGANLLDYTINLFMKLKKEG